MEMFIPWTKTQAGTDKIQETFNDIRRRYWVQSYFFVGDIDLNKIGRLGKSLKIHGADHFGKKN